MILLSHLQFRGQLVLFHKAIKVVNDILKFDLDLRIRTVSDTTKRRHFQQNAPDLGS